MEILKWNYQYSGLYSIVSFNNNQVGPSTDPLTLTCPSIPSECIFARLIVSSGYQIGNYLSVQIHHPQCNPGPDISKVLLTR